MVGLLIFFYSVSNLDGGVAVGNLRIVAELNGIGHNGQRGESEQLPNGSEDRWVNVSHRRHKESQGNKHKGGTEAYPK